MATRTAHWALPTTYSDGSAIPADVLAKLVTHVYRDGVEVAASAPGATEVSFSVDEAQGQSYSYTAKCEVDGVPDDLSAASEVYVYVVPFVPTNPPTGLRIS